MSNQNGQLVLQTLEDLEEPATVVTISKQIADAVGAELSDVKDSIQQTLEAGVRYGYVQCANQKYFTVPVEFVDAEEDQTNDVNNKRRLADELEDRARRRRKTRRRSKRRVGSRRHRRR